MINGSSLTHVALLVLASLLNGDQREWKWDFKNDAVGGKPAEFDFTETNNTPKGRWEIVIDGDEQVLAQLDENDYRRRYTMAVVDESSLEDVDLSVRIKAVKGAGDQSGGIVWRYKDSENYLVARLDVTERDVSVFRFNDGNKVTIREKEGLDLKTGQWYTLRVVHRGPEITVYLDNNALFWAKDKHFHRPGKVGMWTKSESVMYFDDLVAKKLDRPRER